MFRLHEGSARIRVAGGLSLLQTEASFRIESVAYCWRAQVLDRIVVEHGLYESESWRENGRGSFDAEIGCREQNRAGGQAGRWHSAKVKNHPANETARQPFYNEATKMIDPCLPGGSCPECNESQKKEHIALENKIADLERRLAEVLNMDSAALEETEKAELERLARKYADRLTVGTMLEVSRTQLPTDDGTYLAVIIRLN